MFDGFKVCVPECLQCPFSQQGMKTVNFHLLGHHGLHHGMEQILKELEFFALPSKVMGIVVAVGLSSIGVCFEIG